SGSIRGRPSGRPRGSRRRRKNRSSHASRSTADASSGRTRENSRPERLLDQLTFEDQADFLEALLPLRSPEVGQRRRWIAERLQPPEPELFVQAMAKRDPIDADGARVEALLQDGELSF